MVYTVTFNPSLDYVIQVEHLQLGTVNRTKTEHIYPGGKGINVSVLLSNLGIENQALGFVAGFTGTQLEYALKELGCQTDFIRLADGFTRINVKVHSDEESEINGQGPHIQDMALQELYLKLQQLKQGDVLVLAGSIPNTLPSDMYERIMKMLDGSGVNVVVDATKDLLCNVLRYHPFLIKPNHHELGELFGRKLSTEKEIICHAKKLQELGARNVLVSMAGEGAIFVSEQGDTLKKRPPEGTVVNSVGAGDSMVAGFLAGYLNTKDYEKAFELGLACGSASAFQSWIATKADVAALLEKSEKVYGL